MRNIKQLIQDMTLEQKASLCSGCDFWHTEAVAEHGIPAVMVSDGPHGLRKQDANADHLGIYDSIQAVCFPVACATASSFDRQAVREMGETLGNECMAEDVAILLGPAVNIKRSPLCGRNFEYFSEDPFVAGELGCAFTKGVQSRGVGVSVKHFAANNQEMWRVTVSSEMQERTLREIYLPAFEKIVKDAKPQTVMCSYNKLNGVYASENKKLLTDILRDEWGFDGFVVSDWYAVNDRVRALQAGLDLEMPGNDGANDRKIVEAVRTGELSEETLDTAVERILRVVFAYADNCKTAVFDRKADHEKAVAIAEECAVLLKNDGALPLKAGENVLFVGEFAQKPRYQGGGSSHVNAYAAPGAWAFAEKVGARYIKGFGIDGTSTEAEKNEALAAAKKADKVIVFAGLPESYESEGYDRTHIDLPQSQNDLIAALIDAGANVTVVLHNGSPVAMPWIGGVNAVLEMYLGGEGVGEASVRLLYGEKNPCGRLAETFPIRLQDTPCYLHFPGTRKKVTYSEGVFVGYRYYDSKRQDVLFPFGYGLSYTSFAYSDLTLSETSFRDDGTLTVRVAVQNTGARFGKEVVQLYVSDKTGSAVRPVRELKGFEKVALAPGESKTVTFTLDKRSFAYFDEDINDWRCGDGEYEICIARNSRDAGLRASVHLQSATRIPFIVDDNTTLEELFAHPKTCAVLREMLQKLRPDSGLLSETNNDMARAMYMQSPLRNMRHALKMPTEQYDALLATLRAAAAM